MVPLFTQDGQQVTSPQQLLSSDLNFVKGMEGANNWPTRPNSRTVVFDQDDDVMYVIKTDMYNNKDITRKRFYDEPEPKLEDMFVSKQEFVDLKGEIQDVKFAIQQFIATANANNELPDASTDESATVSQHVQCS